MFTLNMTYGNSSHNVTAWFCSTSGTTSVEDAETLSNFNIQAVNLLVDSKGDVKLEFGDSYGTSSILNQVVARVLILCTVADLDPNWNHSASTRSSDLAAVDSQGDLAGVFWVNGTQLDVIAMAPLGMQSTTPETRFPFPRLAVTPNSDMSSTFLYHQINSTTFAVEQWRSASGTWIKPPDYINVYD